MQKLQNDHEDSNKMVTIVFQKCTASSKNVHFLHLYWYLEDLVHGIDEQCHLFEHFIHFSKGGDCKLGCNEEALPS